MTDDQIRLLILHRCIWPFGGAHTAVLRKTRFLKKSGHEVVYCAAADNRLSREIERAGARLYIVEELIEGFHRKTHDELLSTLLRLEKIVKSERINIIEIMEDETVAYGHYIAESNDIAVIAVEYYTQFAQKHFKHWLADLDARHALFGFEQQKESWGEIQRITGGTYSNLHFIPLDIERPRHVPENEKERLRDALGIRGKKVIMSISRMTAMKGYVLPLMKDFKRVAEKEGDVVLLLIGSGELEAAWRKEAAAINREIGHYNSEINFLGEQTDIDAFYQITDVFVGMGTTVLSAAVNGVPALGAGIPPYHTFVSSIPGYNGDCRTGGYVHKNYGSYADNILMLLRDAALHASIARGARTLIENTCLTEAVMPQWMAHYQRLLREKPPSRYTFRIALTDELVRNFGYSRRIFIYENIRAFSRAKLFATMILAAFNTSYARYEALRRSCVQKALQLLAMAGRLKRLLK